MKLKIVIPLTILVVIFGLTWFFWNGSSLNSRIESTSNQTQSPKEPGHEKTNGSATEVTALPDLDMPLSKSIAILNAQSARNDPPSMCRLATEFAYCWDLQQQKKQIASQIETQSSSLQRAPNASVKRDVAYSLMSLLSRERTNNHDLKHCAGVDIPSSDAMIRLVREAALRGHVPSMSVYTSGLMFASSSYLDALESMKTYRDEAERLAISAASKGDLASMFALAEAYRTPNDYIPMTMLGDAIKDDDTEALAYYYQLSTIYENNHRPRAAQARPFIAERIETLSNMLPTASVTRARNMAVERLAKWTLPPVDTQAYVAGIYSNPSFNSMRSACNGGGPQLSGKAYRETLTGE